MNKIKNTKTMKEGVGSKEKGKGMKTGENKEEANKNEDRHAHWKNSKAWKDFMAETREDYSSDFESDEELDLMTLWRNKKEMHALKEHVKSEWETQTKKGRKRNISCSSCSDRDSETEQRKVKQLREAGSSKAHDKMLKASEEEKQKEEDTTAFLRMSRFLKSLGLSAAKSSEAERLMDDISLEQGLELDKAAQSNHKMAEEIKDLKVRLASLEEARPSAIEERLNQLAAKLDSLMSEGGRVRVAQAPRPTLYSDIIKGNKTTTKVAKKATVKEAKPVAAIYPAKGSKIKNSDETKKALAECINPTEQKIRIRNLRKLRNSGILIETETKEDLEQVLQNNKIQATMQIGSLPRRKPKIIIYGVPSGISEEELCKSVRNQNLELGSEDKLEEEFRLLFKTGKKDTETTNWVAEVSSKTRKILLSRSRVFVGFNAHGVKDYIAVARCFKCQSFGHVSKHCKSKTDTCGHCGKDGHVFKDCPNKQEKATCINCKRGGKTANHDIKDKKCPAYKYAIEKCLSNIDFGN